KCVDRGYPMTERQSGKLLAAVTHEKALSGDGESVNPLLNQLRECRIDFARGGGTGDYQLVPEQVHRRLHICLLKLGIWIGRVNEEPKSSCCRHELAEQAQPFRAKCIDQMAHPGDVAVRSREVVYKSDLDRVCAHREHDRNLRRCCLGREG